MKKKVVSLVIVFLLIVSVTAQTEVFEKECGFFCKLENWLSGGQALAGKAIPPGLKETFTAKNSKNEDVVFTYEPRVVYIKDKGDFYVYRSLNRNVIFVSVSGDQVFPRAIKAGLNTETYIVKSSKTDLFASSTTPTKATPPAPAPTAPATELVTKDVKTPTTLQKDISLQIGNTHIKPGQEFIFRDTDLLTDERKFRFTSEGRLQELTTLKVGGGTQSNWNDIAIEDFLRARTDIGGDNVDFLIIGEQKVSINEKVDILLIQPSSARALGAVQTKGDPPKGISDKFSGIARQEGWGNRYVYFNAEGKPIAISSDGGSTVYGYSSVDNDGIVDARKILERDLKGTLKLKPSIPPALTERIVAETRARTEVETALESYDTDDFSKYDPELDYGSRFTTEQLKDARDEDR